MSSDVALGFFGVRVAIPREECESVEERTHPLVKLARQHKLHHYFCNLAAPDEKLALFLGRKLGLIGWENSFEVALSGVEMDLVMKETAGTLREAGIETPPMLFLQFLPDA